MQKLVAKITYNNNVAVQIINNKHGFNVVCKNIGYR